MPIIIYDLECEFAHRFEGWFQSRQDFNNQRDSKLLTCPQCGTPGVRKLAHRVNLRQKLPPAHAASSSLPTNTAGTQIGETGDHAQEKPPQDAPKNAFTAPQTIDVATAFVLARQAIQAVFKHSEDVGNAFAEEARKIHYEEAPIRAIRGTASPEEFEELLEEGIDIIALPTPPPEEELN
ncbi:MAG: DUF1178 family protein [Limnobacter sp.]|nr:DUF1178 family protein [Limnobacter sp.]